MINLLLTGKSKRLFDLMKNENGRHFSSGREMKIALNSTSSAGGTNS